MQFAGIKNGRATGGKSIGHKGGRGARILLVLLMPLALVLALMGVIKPDVIRAGAASQARPLIQPPSNLQVVPLDSSLHVTWDPSTDTATAWHVMSIWDGTMLQQTKVGNRTARALQANGLVPNHTYTVKVQAMDAQGNKSTPIETTVSTDKQYPMRDAAFFENFNEPAGDLDYNYFDVRTSHGEGLQPESIGTDKMLVFNNENHFHTQMIGGVQRGELYIRPRVPFDFAGRTGTLQFEVDTAPVQHSNGKWFEIHLVRNVPWSSEEFGAGEGDQYPDSMEFSVRGGDGPDPSVNLAQITVNIGGSILQFQGNVRQMTPANIRMPVVIKVSQTSAQFFINGVLVAQASGYTLPFTQGYWMMAHRSWYGSRDLSVQPVILQLVHWETIQFDGPTGSYNPIVRTYIQPGCPGVVHNEHDGVVGCQKITLGGQQNTTNMGFNVQEGGASARSARVFFNGTSDTGSIQLNVNGHTATVPVTTCCYQNTLNSYSFPASWLRDGSNSLSLSITSGGAEISQIETEVVFDELRTIPDPAPVHSMPMLSLTAMSFRFDHTAGDPMVVTGTTYLYNMGSTDTVNYTASVISTETPWLTVSPGSGTATSPMLGGNMIPLTLSVDFTNIAPDLDGEVGVVKVVGGNMPLYVAVLAVNDGTGPHPVFLPAFTGLNTTFNKDAIPDYHGPNGTPSPTAVVPTPTPGGPPTSTAVATATSASTPAATSTPGGCTATFTDVGPDYWAYQYISYMACQGIVSGYADGTFRPGSISTRGQVAKIVVLGEGWPLNTTGGPHFSDVPQSNAFYAYIETAYNRGIISGYSDGTFRWGNNITRAQLSKVIVSAEGWQIDTTGGPHFADVPATDPFYAYIETAYNRTIISGYADGTFRPGNNATRAQLSKIFYLALTGVR